MSNNSNGTLNGAGKYGSSKRSAGTASGADALEEVDPGLVLSCLVAVLREGDGMIWGTTRDGGAVAVTLMSGGASDKLYAAHREEIEELLRGVFDVAAGR